MGWGQASRGLHRLQQHFVSARAYVPRWPGCFGRVRRRARGQPRYWFQLLCHCSCRYQARSTHCCNRMPRSANRSRCNPRRSCTRSRLRTACTHTRQVGCHPRYYNWRSTNSSDASLARHHRMHRHSRTRRCRHTARRFAVGVRSLHAAPQGVCRAARAGCPARTSPQSGRRSVAWRQSDWRAKARASWPSWNVERTEVVARSRGVTYMYQTCHEMTI